MNANYWSTVNEGGEGYVKRAPEARCREEVESDLLDAQRDLVSAKVNAAYKNNEDGTDYKVERLEAKIAKLLAELGLPAAPVEVVVPVTVQAADVKTYAYEGEIYTRQQLGMEMSRVGSDRAKVAEIKKILGL